MIIPNNVFTLHSNQNVSTFSFSDYCCWGNKIEWSSNIRSGEFAVQCNKYANYESNCATHVCTFASDLIIDLHCLARMPGMKDSIEMAVFLGSPLLSSPIACTHCLPPVQQCSCYRNRCRFSASGHSFLNSNIQPSRDSSCLLSRSTLQNVILSGCIESISTMCCLSCYHSKELTSFWLSSLGSLLFYTSCNVFFNKNWLMYF